MPSLIERCIALARGVPDSDELKRILDLPKRTLDLQSMSDLTPLFRKEHGTMTLYPIQNAALFEMERMRGGLFPIGVGHGKTAISLLAGEALDVERVVLLVPPSLKGQLLKHDIPRYGEHFSFRIPHVVSYSELSSQKTAQVLEDLNPQLIVADEAHCLKDMKSTRTKRFLRYMRNHEECMFVALSGTMTSKSIRDYAHLAELALREKSPVPQKWGVLEDWCVALDPNDYNAPPGALLKLCEENHDHPSVRERFRCRLNSSYGVVSTSESALGTSLIIRARVPNALCDPRETRRSGSVEGVRDRGRDSKGGSGSERRSTRLLDVVPPVIAEALATLRETWCRPDGEELEEATRFHQVAAQIAQGFYLRWAWPKGQVDHEWLKARGEWHREVRAYLGRSAAPGRDSFGLVASLAEREPGTFATYAAWRAVKDRPIPPTVVVWLSDYLVRDAAEWLSDGGIVWTVHPAFGEALSKVANVPFFGAGAEEILTTPAEAIVASLSAHGTGKNLQRYSRMLFTNVPGNKAMEQGIARCHRPGQQEDEVTVDMYLHTQEFRTRFDKTLEEAAYVEQSTGQKQKLLMATRIME